MLALDEHRILMAEVPIMEHAVIVTLVATDELVELALVVLEAANDLAAFSIFALIDSENAVIGQDESDALRDFATCVIYIVPFLNKDYLHLYTAIAYN